MKIIIVHGWEGSPDREWFPWINKELSEKGFENEALRMPNPDKPDIKEWVSFLEKHAGIDEETFFVGHSIGCQAILRFLETLSEGKIGGCLFVGGWTKLKESVLEDKETGKIAKPWLETPINWNKILGCTNNFIALFSEDDPYVPLSEKEVFEKNLNAKIFIEKNMGHFTGKEYPIILEKIMELIK